MLTPPVMPTLPVETGVGVGLSQQKTAGSNGDFAKALDTASTALSTDTAATKPAEDTAAPADAKAEVDPDAGKSGTETSGEGTGEQASDDTEGDQTQQAVQVPVLVAPLPTLPVETAAPALPPATTAPVAEVEVAPVTTLAPLAPVAPAAPTTAPAVNVTIDEPVLTTSKLDVIATPATVTVAMTATTPTDVPEQQVFNDALAEVVTTEIVNSTTELGTKAETKATNAAAVIADLGAKVTNPTNVQAPVTSATATTVAGSREMMSSSAAYNQVVSVVNPLKAQGDGNYTMTLNLRPEHLGKVQVAVSMQNGEISMQMQADNPNARQLLRDSMIDLRNSLVSAGLSTGAMDVDAGNAGEQQRPQFSSSHNASQTGSSDDEMSDAEFFARLAPATNGRTADGSFDARV